MAETLGSLRTKALRWLDETDNTTETYDNVTEALKLSHRQRCTENLYSFMLWRQPETFTLVANQRRYVLHPQVGKMLYVFDRTNNRYLVETPWREVQASDVRWMTDTTGKRYVFVEPSPVATQNPAAGTVTVVSSSAGDTGSSFNITITGTVDGVEVTETVTPLGLTPVATSNTWDAASLIAVNKTAAWSGTLTLSQTTTTLLTLRPAELSRSYPQIELLWLPQSADTIEYRFYRKPRGFANASDVPDIPDEYADILLWDTLILMAAYDGEITEARLSAWVDQREKLNTALGQTYLEGSTMAAETRIIRDIENDDTWW